jgi:hypothetical protein
MILYGTPIGYYELVLLKSIAKARICLSRIQEGYIILLLDKTYRKIKIPKVLNWDSTGYPEKNIVNVSRDERRFNLLMEEEPQIIRIALHPRDPHQALEEQKEMIYKLKKMHYKMVTYKELTPKL